MSCCGQSLKTGVSIADRAVKSCGPFLALALIAMCAPPLIGQTGQSSAQSSSSAEGKDRFQLGGGQAKAADAQPAQCKKDEDENAAWRPKASVLVDDSSAKQSSPAAKPLPENKVPTGGPAAAKPAPAANPPVALSGPIIVYADGKLAIRARDVALGEVLDAIKARTGIVVEYPTGGAAERVFVDIHLMPMQEALTELLDGSRFNYILALSSNPQIVKQVILTNKNGPSNVAVASPMSPQPGGVEVNSNEAYTADQADYTPPVQSAPNTIPTIPASLGLSVTAEDLKKPTAQLLDELQKQQNRLLDAAAEKAAAAAETSPH